MVCMGAFKGFPGSHPQNEFIPVVKAYKFINIRQNQWSPSCTKIQNLRKCSYLWWDSDVWSCCWPLHFQKGVPTSLVLFSLSYYFHMVSMVIVMLRIPIHSFIHYEHL